MKKRKMKELQMPGEPAVASEDMEEKEQEEEAPPAPVS